MTSKLVGVLGGMGPFASAEFINTIYELNLPQNSEQESPRIVLCSDPSIPDRTSSILANQKEEMIQRLLVGWKRLQAAGAEVYIIPCMTSHYYWSFFPSEMRTRTVNLAELVHNTLRQKQGKYLLLATKGTYDSRLLTSDQVVIPNSPDQARIHQLIYSIKCTGKHLEVLKKARSEAEDLLVDYEADGWIFGCTEFHLLTKNMLQEGHDIHRILDPLFLLAQQWKVLEDFVQPALAVNVF